MSQQNPTDEEILRAHAFFAVNRYSNKIIKQEELRRLLKSGTSYKCEIKFDVKLNINDNLKEFQEIIEYAKLVIEHDGTTASTTTPEVEKLIAYILSHLNKTTQDKILNNLIDDYMDGNLDQRIQPNLLWSVKRVLQQLRAENIIDRKGDVSVYLPSVNHLLDLSLLDNILENSNVES